MKSKMKHLKGVRLALSPALLLLALMLGCAYEESATAGRAAEGEWRNDDWNEHPNYFADELDEMLDGVDDDINWDDVFDTENEPPVGEEEARDKAAEARDEEEEALFDEEEFNEPEEDGNTNGD